MLDFNREKDAVVALEKIKSALEVMHIRISENEYKAIKDQLNLRIESHFSHKAR